MKLVIDSGATSNFVPKVMNLPKKGKSNKEVHLPDNTKLQTFYKTKLLFKQLTSRAREAEILPGLRTPLVSIKKWPKKDTQQVSNQEKQEQQSINQAQS
jgi:hypothetical protein